MEKDKAKHIYYLKSLLIMMRPVFPPTVYSFFSSFTAKSEQIMNYESLNCTFPNNGKTRILQYIVRLMHSNAVRQRFVMEHLFFQICLPLF